MRVVSIDSCAEAPGVVGAGSVIPPRSRSSLRFVS